jgi:hypothetical protein
MATKRGYACYVRNNYIKMDKMEVSKIAQLGKIENVTVSICVLSNTTEADFQQNGTLQMKPLITKPFDIYLLHRTEILPKTKIS